VTLVTAKSKLNESFAMKRMSKQSIVDSEHQQRVILEKVRGGGRGGGGRKTGDIGY